MNIVQLIQRFHSDETGATSIEYAFQLCLLSLAILGSVDLFGGAQQKVWAHINTRLEEELGASFDGGEAYAHAYPVDEEEDASDDEAVAGEDDASQLGEEDDTEEDDTSHHRKRGRGRGFFRWFWTY